MPSGLPQEAEVYHVAYVAKPSHEQRILVELPKSFQQFAILVEPETLQQSDHTERQFQILTIPAINHQDADLQLAARDWVDVAARQFTSPLQFMTLQGAQIFWTSGRVAVLAQADRLETVRSALIEASWYEAELRDMEQTLGEAWPQMEEDMPLAFSFNAKAISRRPQLLERFQKVVLIQSRLARLAPHIHCPHLHPPTLASQVGERFRERSRMIHRHEILGEQVEVFEKIYDTCGQRSSDYMLSRTGHFLEMIIIVLLVTQILLWSLELLSSTGQ
jgi:hypothetical protein